MDRAACNPTELDRPGFTHVFHRKDAGSSRTLVLLHGSGGDETTLLPIARKAAPGASLLAVRGRVVQDGVTRWYRRVTAVRFDQADIRAEVDAFAAFLRAAATAYDFDPTGVTFIGYSNGANLVSSLALMYPALVRRAALLRSMPVLEAPPPATLWGADFLLVAGKDDDLYARYAPALEALLRENGATVEPHLISAGHGLSPQDERLLADWLAAQQGVPG